MNLKKIQNSPILPIILIGGSGIALYFVYKAVKGTTNFLNITSSKEDKTAQKIITSTPQKNPFNPSFWKEIKPKGNLKRVQLIKVNTAENLSKQLRNAIGYFTSDYTQVMGVFSQLKYKSQVSFLSDYFQKKYKDDLFQYLRAGYSLLITNTGLSDKELDNIIKYVNNLPLGLIK
jgi:hypothetical protein